MPDARTSVRASSYVDILNGHVLMYADRHINIYAYWTEELAASPLEVRYGKLGTRQTLQEQGKTPTESGTHGKLGTCQTEEM